MMRTQIHVRIDLTKAQRLGYTVLQNDENYLELLCEAREFNAEPVVEALQEVEYTPAEIDTVLSTIYEIAQMKMLRKIIG